MNNSAAKVGEIFREAGTAFTKLSEMTLMLQPTDDATPGSKWSEEEVEMLRGCVNRFAVELNKISQHIKNRTMNYLRRYLDMDTGTICSVSRLPPQQQQLTSQPRQQLQLTSQPLQQHQLIHQTLQQQQVMEQPLQPQQLIPQPVQQHQLLLQQQLIPQPILQQQLFQQPLQQQQLFPQTCQQQQANSQPLPLQQLIPQQLRRGQLISPLYQQPEQSFPWEHQSQINSTWSQPFITLETETQIEVLFPDEYLSKNNDNIADLLHFNPEIVPLTPPANIMQDDKKSEEPPSEFDDIDDDKTETIIRAVIPNLIHILDLDFYRFIHLLDFPENNRNLGTLHAVIPESNLQAATGTLNSDSNITMVTKKGYFNWSRATKTWEYANQPAAKAIITDNIQNIEKPYEIQILPTRSDFSLENFLNSDPVSSVQATAEKTYEILPADNENIYIANQNTPQLHTDPVPGAFSSIFRQNNVPFRAQTGGSLSYNSVGCAGSEPEIDIHLNTDSFNSVLRNYFLNDNSLNGAQVQTSAILAWDDPLYQFIDIQKKSKVEKEEDSPGPFSSLMSKICSQENPFKNIQTQSHEPKSSNLFENSSNPSVQALSETTGYLGSIQTKNNEQVLPSRLQRTRGSRGGRISGRRGRYTTRTSANLASRIISNLPENTAGSNDNQNQTRLRRRQACIDDDIGKSISKKRKMVTIVTTLGPTTRSQSKKQSQ